MTNIITGVFYRHVIARRSRGNLNGNATALTSKAAVLVIPECQEPAEGSGIHDYDFLTRE